MNYSHPHGESDTGAQPLSQDVFSHVSAWLDGELDQPLCEQLCQQLGSDCADTVDTAFAINLIGQALRGDARGAAEIARSQRVLSNVRAYYSLDALATPTTREPIAPAGVAPANDVWFSWRGVGSAAAVVLALGLWWYLPNPAADDATKPVALAASAPAGEGRQNLEFSVDVAHISFAKPIGSVMAHDLQLHTLLAAHRQMGASHAWPGAVGFVRNVAWTGAGE